VAAAVAPRSPRRVTSSFFIDASLFRCGLRVDGPRRLLLGDAPDVSATLGYRNEFSFFYQKFILFGNLKRQFVSPEPAEI
jgi:hypothetical protein